MVENRADENLLPVDPNTKRPITPSKQPGYYPGYSTLSQKKFWDAATRETVEKRVYNVPKIRFFTPEESVLMQAVIDRILPQDDRLPGYRIPVLNYIDERLFEGQINGYRYADMPPDREAHKLGLEAIQEIAYSMFGKPFLDLEPIQKDRVLKSIHDGEKKGAHKIWERMSVHRYWQLLVQDCVNAYYSHPWAWDEIGYGGPAYPRAYTRLENGLPEPWEVDEQRYEWEAPETSISGRMEDSGAGETTHMGQGGTH